MKVLVFVAALCLLVALSSQGTNVSYAEDITYDAFMGIKWGTSSNRIAGLHYVGPFGNKDYTKYRRPGHKMVVGNASLGDITYIFWRDKLIRVEVHSIPRHCFTSLVDHYVDFWGEPEHASTSEHGSSYWWKIGAGELWLSQANGLGAWLDLTSLAIMEEKNDYESKKDTKAGWKCNYSDFNKECFYTPTIDSTSKGIRRATVKFVILNGPNNESLTMTNLIDIDCINQRARILETKTMAGSKPAPAVYKADSSWSPYLLKSPAGRLYNMVCEAPLKN